MEILIKEEKMNCFHRKIELLLFYVFFISSLIFISSNIAEARTRHNYHRSYRSSRINYNSKPTKNNVSSYGRKRQSLNLTYPNKRNYAVQFFINFLSIFLLFPLHLLGCGILIYIFKDPHEKLSNGISFIIIFSLIFLVCPLSLLIDILAIGYAINSFIKYKKLVHFGYESNLKQEQEKHTDLLNSNKSNNNLNINWVTIDDYSKKDFLRLTISVMLADGVIDPREMNIIKNICRRYAIPENEINNIVNELKNVLNPLDYILGSSNLKYDKNILLILITIAASDGQIADEEVVILERIAEKINVPKRLLMNMINQIYEKMWHRKANAYRLI